MFTFSLDLKNVIESHNCFWESLSNDFELVKSFNLDIIQIYYDNLSCPDVNDHLQEFKLSFKLKMKTEIEIDKNFYELIEELKLGKLLINENTAYLPFWIKFDLIGYSLVVTSYVFWMKKKLNQFEIFKQNLVLDEIKDSLFFSIIESFKNSIGIPEKNTLLNWLQQIKEENIIMFQKEIPIDSIIYEKGDEDLNLNNQLNEEENQDKQSTGLNLLMARSEKITANKKTKNIQSNVSVESVKEEQLYKTFFEEGGIVGDIILDRGSTFQSHAIKIKNIKEIEKYLSYLKNNNKIIKATHNILAYRYSSLEKKSSNEKYAILEGFDDDGEDGAGIRLLGILQKMKVNNVMVVVSRWFGGTNLGNDRFKHINDSAKNLIIQNKSLFDFLP